MCSSDLICQLKFNFAAGFFTIRKRNILKIYHGKIPPAEIIGEDLMGRSVFALSGGEKQKIACASSSVLLPGIMVLDEPSSNLDMAAIDDLRQVLSLWKKQGKTILIAEHRLYYLQIFNMIIGNCPVNPFQDILLRIA